MYPTQYFWVANLVWFGLKLEFGVRVIQLQILLCAQIKSAFGKCLFQKALAGARLVISFVMDTSKLMRIANENHDKSTT